MTACGTCPCNLPLTHIWIQRDYFSADIWLSGATEIEFNCIFGTIIVK